MKTFKLLFLTTLLFVVGIGSSAAQNTGEDFKVLAQGDQSEVDKPFIFVARDAKTYAQLRELIAELPAPETINFAENAAVAAFAGTKNNGGYQVQISKTSQTNMIDLVAPPKGAMTMQVITQPFKAVLIPIAHAAPLPLDSGATWANAMENYRVTSGNFEFAGGIAGKRTGFAANGGISIWTYADYATIFLNLRGLGTQKNRRLMEHASGTLKNGKLDFARLDAGGFAAKPNAPFAISGTTDGKNMFLNFKSRRAKTADGFAGGGKIGAVKVQ